MFTPRNRAPRAALLTMAGHLAMARRLVVVAAIFATITPASAQTFDRGPFVPGVRLAVGLDPYDITGSTAPQIMRQLQISGQRSLLYFDSFFTWSYDAERIPRLNGTLSDQCRFTDFEVVADFTATYPRWSPTDDTDPRVTEAWAAFQAEMETRWAVERDEFTARAAEAVRRARGHEDHCPLLAQRFHTELIELLDRRRPLQGRDDVERVALSWPPSGYDELISAAGAQGATAEAPGSSSGGREVGDAAVDAGAGDETSGGDAMTLVDARAPRVAIRPGRPIPVTTPAPSLDQAIQTDLRGRRPFGLAAGLYHQGSLQLLDAVGSETEDGPPVTIDTPFALPAFTHVLIATLAVALDASGFLELDAPISTYLDGLSPRLGAVTTGQLIDHEAGLDNAPPADSTMAWSEVLDRLNDRALFTEPGVLPSYSAYSYGLATRVLEEVTRLPLEEALEQTLFTPLAMASTSLGPPDPERIVDGVPVTSTSAADLMRFAIAWLDGSIAGAGVDLFPEPDAVTLALDGRAFRGGFWVDRPGGVPRLSLICATAGPDSFVQLFPRSRTVLLSVGHGAGPRHTTNYLLDATGEALRIGNEVFGPVQLAGIAGFGQRPRPCGFIRTAEVHRPVDFGPRLESGDWAGRYINGDWFFALNEADGLLTSPRAEGSPWQIHHFEGDRYFAGVAPEEREGVGFPFRLFRGTDGRRYLMLADRAYVHEDDRPGR